MSSDGRANCPRYSIATGRKERSGPRTCWGIGRSLARRSSISLGWMGAHADSIERTHGTTSDPLEPVCVLAVCCLFFSFALPVRTLQLSRGQPPQ